MNFDELKLKLTRELKLCYMEYSWLEIDTKFTKNFVEILMPTAKDRGRIKWIAANKTIYFDTVNNDLLKATDKQEAYRSHIDNADLFPRMYFLIESFVNEYIEWIKERELEVIDIQRKK